MIDHVGYSVTDFEKSKKFYEKALAPLQYQLKMVVPAEVTGTTAAAGFGIGDKLDFWLSDGPSQTGSIHICFRAASRAEVDAFYTEAIKAGGRDNGKPGLRPHYHPNYYGAFVYDPDGYNVEAVFHGENSK